MQLGILGLPKAGKTTLYNTLTASHETTDKFAASKKTHIAVARVPDPRLETLRELADGHCERSDNTLQQVRGVGLVRVRFR